MRETAAPFVARPSVRKLMLLLGGNLIFVFLGMWLAGLLGPAPKASAEWIGWMSIVLFGAFAAICVQRLFDNGTQIVINDQGFYWKQWSATTIPWDQILEVKEVRVQRQSSLALRLAQPERYPSTTLIGRLSSAYRVFGIGDFAINTAGTDKSFSELRDAVFAHWNQQKTG